MKIDLDLILNLENLAKLDLSEVERIELQHDLGNIFDLVEKLMEIDTTDIEPLVFINEENNIFRKDEVGGQVSLQEAVSNAPQKEGAYFKVPKIL